MVPLVPPVPGPLVCPQAVTLSNRPSGTAASKLIRCVMHGHLRIHYEVTCLMDDSVPYARHVDSVVDCVHDG